jgi:transcriptional regulator with XRE-family HTH domain
MDELKKRFAEAVKVARGWRTQRDFAELIGCSQSAVTNWERARNLPDLEGLEKLAKIRGQLPEHFLAELYGRKTETSLQERINEMSDEEVAWLMTLLAQRVAVGRGDSDEE